MNRFSRCGLAAVLGAAGLAATGPARAESPTPLLDAVVVSGVQPGPGLWKISRGESVLWILGTLSPVPKRMEWRTDEVEAVIATAKEMIGPVSVKLDAGVGWFRGLFLLPKLIGVRKNPDDATLADQLPEPMYQRWLTLKQKYMPRSRRVEKWRPLFAAQELYSQAIDEVDLSERSVVAPAVKKLAKRHKLPITEIELEVKLDNPKQLIDRFKASELNDTECFAKTLDHLESDLGMMKARANAWAIGDVELLKSLPQTDPGPACIEAIVGASAFQGQGLEALPARVKTAWLTAAETALQKDQVSFATLPMSRILANDGYVAALRERGYTVEAPE